MNLIQQVHTEYNENLLTDAYKNSNDMTWTATNLTGATMIATDGVDNDDPLNPVLDLSSYRTLLFRTAENNFPATGSSNTLYISNNSGKAYRWDGLTYVEIFINSIPEIGTNAPNSATDTGTLGEVRVTSTYIYACVSTNTWVRAPLATW